MITSRQARSAKRWILVVLGGSLVLLAGGCANGPKSYAKPEAAVESLVAALRAQDREQLEQVLGPDSEELLSSGDEVADANGRAEFLKLYDQKHALKPDGADSITLEVGGDDWPLPIPLVKGADGWYFDTAAGLDEMLSRRIGQNELSAMQVCLAIADAQREYAAADPDGDGWRAYARQFASDPGKKNGLFWKAAPGEPDSPLGELVATASGEGYTGESRSKTTPQPYHGYLYRILTEQGPAAPGGAMSYLAQERMIGGFAILAWPAEYGSSGLKSFMVSHHGVLFEADLGDDTDRISRKMTAFDPGKGWTKASPGVEAANEAAVPRR